MGDKRRDDMEKQETMMNFIVLKMLYDGMKQEDLKERAKERSILGRVKFIDQTFYEMAKRRREAGACPPSPPKKKPEDAKKDDKKDEKKDEKKTDDKKDEKKDEKKDDTKKDETKKDDTAKDDKKEGANK